MGDIDRGDVEAALQFARKCGSRLLSGSSNSTTVGEKAMALIQTFTVIVALVILYRLTRGMTKELT